MYRERSMPQRSAMGGRYEDGPPSSGRYEDGPPGLMGRSTRDEQHYMQEDRGDGWGGQEEDSGFRGRDTGFDDQGPGPRERPPNVPMPKGTLACPRCAS